MRISDWSSDVCSSDLLVWLLKGQPYSDYLYIPETSPKTIVEWSGPIGQIARVPHPWGELHGVAARDAVALTYNRNNIQHRSEEHTSELQSLMRISYAVFCLKKNTTQQYTQTKTN